MPHTIAEDGEADAVAAAGDAAVAGADAVAAGVLPADESAPAAGTASPPSEAPAAAEIAVAAKGDAAAPGSEAAAVGADAAAMTGPALDDANYDPRWEGTLEKHEVGKLNYNELRIADGNKVWREYPADADAGDPNTQNNSEDADAKSATPQRDNRSAAEAPSAEAPSLTQRLAAVADAWSPRLLCASFAGSVVGDHFGSGKAARVGGGGRVAGPLPRCSMMRLLPPLLLLRYPSPLPLPHLPPLLLCLPPPPVPFSLRLVPLSRL